ncbi:hypothetical protein [Jeongeupia naejangsanensis]|uniref:Uncharacterized protein n=1 Tax=Jeongeupia naejangsanensis TaxID=613195 RepID=A0ABS2BH88_9NEIS|nr:hypothetical protein [Jeongeupia naejangsanensis]MBM3114982.1 hypothetical protein [Jeongeupia naejangsanensis]
MLNILSDSLGKLGTPTYPLKQAADNLQVVGELALATPTPIDIIMRNKFVIAATRMGGKTAIRPEFTTEKFIEQIRYLMTSEFGTLKGPCQNALQELPSLAIRAKLAGYPLENSNVQKAFFGFLMSYVTEGFVNQDTTGTQMGNFQGKWHGGGF